MYLIDSAPERGSRSRVLYWFRTPPGVKVGRSPFDPETQRSLERQNPEVQFDWPQIVAARMPPPAPVENWREKRRAERAIKRARAAEAAEAAEGERITAQVGEEDVTVLEDLEPDELAAAVAETLEEPSGQELTDEAVGGPGPDPAAGAVGTMSNSQPVQQATQGPRRGRRRRRRRGRRPGDRPREGEQGPAQNEPLDPEAPAREPSNEG